jgi:WD40 repeat protein/tetratricopeptide (TPR) repeat protein
MPFQKPDSNEKTPQPSTGIPNLFSGRASELEFFVQQTLKPEYPAHNIISISGDGGVGKSTLLSVFIDIIHSPDFRNYCLTAMVDEKQTTSASMMEEFAKQLRRAGYPLTRFENELTRYKEALRKSQSKGEDTGESSLRKATAEVAGATVKDVPVVGAVLEKGVGLTVEYILDELDHHQLRKEAELLEHPLSDLTQAFVNDLNRVTDRQVTFDSQPKKNSWLRTIFQRLLKLHQSRLCNLRVILFFDTFEQLAIEAAPWMLDHFLKVNISRNVVLVVAGREPLNRSISSDPKRWLPYYENGTVYSLSLESFTEEETRSYLMKRGITEPERINTIWQLSRGLPLYLGLLTSNLQGDIDPTADVVANFLRWIPEQASLKRRLALGASLFSRPFNQDDLEALTYFPKDEEQKAALYRWLGGLPFVRSNLQDGRHRYHELAREMFSRHLYYNSPKEYYATRKVIADHYWDLLDLLQAERGKELYDSGEWLELTLALVSQLFFLPDESSHINAIEHVLHAYEHTNQSEEIFRLLRELSQEQPTSQISASARQIARQLLEYFAFNMESQAFIAATSGLLDKIAHQPSFPRGMLARIYRNRGRAYRERTEYEQALKDLDQALSLDSNFVWAYSSRGTTYRLLNDYQQAIADFDYALKLDPAYIWAYIGRGTTYRLRKDYQQAIADFDHALALDSKNIWVYSLRGETYYRLKQYERAIEDFNQALSLDPQAFWTYGLRGIAYVGLKKHEQAIKDFDQVLEISPQSTWAKELRDEVYRSDFVSYATHVVPPPPTPSSAPETPKPPSNGFPPSFQNIPYRVSDVILEGVTRTMPQQSPGYDVSPNYPYPTRVSPITHSPSGPILYTTYGGHYQTITTVAWSPNGEALASGSWDGIEQVRDAGTAKYISGYRGHISGVTVVAWSPDGKKIASAAWDNTVHVWDAATGKPILMYRGHSAGVSAVAWSRDGRWLASGSSDKTVQIWDTTTGNLILTYMGHAQNVRAVAWSPDSRRLASGSDDKTVQVWNTTTGNLTLTYHGHSAEVLVVVWSPDGKRIASSSSDQTVQTWDSSTGKSLLTHSYHAGIVSSLAWSPDGSRIASAASDGTAQVWNAANGKLISAYHGPSGVVVWSPDGKRIASAGSDMTVRVWGVK